LAGQLPYRRNMASIPTSRAFPPAAPTAGSGQGRVAAGMGEREFGAGERRRRGGRLR
jgi:hypothetical protein